MPQVASITVAQFELHKDNRGTNFIGKFSNRQWRAKAINIAYNPDGSEKSCWVILEAEGTTEQPAVRLGDAIQLLKQENGIYVCDKTKTIGMSRDSQGVITMSNTGSAPRKLKPEYVGKDITKLEAAGITDIYAD